MNKIIFLFIAICFTYSCNNANNKANKEDISDIKVLNDSINKLITFYQQDKDSTELKIALSLNDRVLSLDKKNKNQFYNYNTRIQILSLLNRKKEAFLLNERILNKDSLNIDRLMYYGLKYNLKKQEDSSNFYFNKALYLISQNDSLDTNLIIKKTYIFIYQDKKDTAKKVIEDELRKNPDNEILQVFNEDFDEYYNITKDTFKDIEL